MVHGLAFLEFRIICKCFLTSKQPCSVARLCSVLFFFHECDWGHKTSAPSVWLQGSWVRLPAPFLLFIANRKVLCRKKKKKQIICLSIAWTLPSSKWFCKVRPLKCLLFFKSFDEIIVATCLQRGKLFLLILYRTHFVPFFAGCYWNMQPHSVLANCVKSLFRFTFRLPQVIFCRSVSHSCPEAWRLCTVCIWSSSMQSNVCVCVRVCGALSFVFDCSKKIKTFLCTFCRGVVMLRRIRAGACVGCLWMAQLTEDAFGVPL